MLSTHEQSGFASKPSERCATESAFSGNANEGARLRSTESAVGHPKSFHQNTHRRLLPGTTPQNQRDDSRMPLQYFFFPSSK